MPEALLQHAPTALLGLVLGALVLVLYRRGSRARQGLAREQHDVALAASRRADHLQAQLDTLAMGQKIDHLHSLIRHARDRGALPEEAALRLGEYALRLRDELAAGAGSSAAEPPGGSA